MRWRLAVMLVIGCNPFYGLDETDLVVEPDTDGDTIVDRDDNCPADMNFDQNDIDGDQRGDVCDDCPLLANDAGGSDFDGDGIADVCDAHPVRPDCLVFVDSFRDPAAFAANWSVVVEQQANGTATPLDGYVGLDANGSKVTILAQGTTDVMDVMALGETTSDVATVQAIAGFQPMQAFYGCELSAPVGMNAIGPATGVTVLAKLVPPDPINNRFLLRLVNIDTKVAIDPIDVACRVDYGVAVGTDVRPLNERLSGGAGVRATLGTSKLDAVSITRERVTVPCPPTVYR